jgi:lipoprotein signal peptidase
MALCDRAAALLKPTKLKMVFIVEWAMFILIGLLRGSLDNRHQLVVVIYPLAFFYLVACGLTELSRSTHQISRGYKLIMIGIGLTIVEQIGKTSIAAFLPNQASIPVIKGWLHLGHVRNAQGSWIVGTFIPGFCSPILLMGLVGCVLLGSWFCYRYYITTHRQSIWTDFAFLGVFAGSLSWLFDMLVRGYIVDFIRLPDVMTADFKDILVGLGVGAFIAESIDNPDISFRWKGWRTEGLEFQQLIANLWSFSIKELQRTRQTLLAALGKSSEA